MYVQNIQTVVSSLDWKLITETDPSLIEMKTDTAAMSKIMSAIVNCDSAADSQINQNPNIQKLVRLSQVIFRYLMKCQDDLKNKNHEQEEYITKLEKALRDSKRKSKKLLLVAQKLRRGEKCPACGRPFESSQTLNSHIKRRHAYIYDAWMSIRRNEPCTVTLPKDKLQAQIDELQRKLAKVEKKQRVSQQNLGPSGRVPLNPFVERPQQPQHEETSDGEIETEFLDTMKAPMPAPAPAPAPVPAPEPVREVSPTVEASQNFHVSTDAFGVAPTPQASPRKKLPDNIKARAKNFLFRTSMPPVLPGQIDEIVGRITEIVHEQGRAAGFYKEDADTDEMREEVENDLNEQSPLPKKPVANPLKEIKKPLKRFKRKSKKPKVEEESSRLKETIQGERLYGDSMPLTSTNELSQVDSGFGEYLSEYQPPPRLTEYETERTKTQAQDPYSGYYYEEEEELSENEPPPPGKTPPKATPKPKDTPKQNPPPPKKSEPDYDDYDYYSDPPPPARKPPQKGSAPPNPQRRPPTATKPKADDYSYYSEAPPVARRPPTKAQPARKPPTKAQAPPPRSVPKPKPKAKQPQPEYSYYSDSPPPPPKARVPPKPAKKKEYSYDYSEPTEPFMANPKKGRAPPTKKGKWEGFRSEYDITESD